MPIPIELFTSGGLGLSRDAWERQHIQSDPTQLGFLALGETYDNLYDVTFVDEKVWQIERQWPAGEGPEIALATAWRRNSCLPTARG